MRTLARTLLVASVALTAPVAAARTMAVMPIDMGAGSQEYDGLGLALAGMLTTDLSRVEALQLVERERLDDILEEIELGEQGYLDPKTAAAVGNGLGAELIVVGSYSVVGSTFVLDARIVEVESSNVLRAENATGTIEDFVTVEKDLVEKLLDGFEVEVSSSERRKIIAAAPTESFEAFSAYGGGLAAQKRGEIALAGERYQQALKLDPEFAAAQEAMLGLRARLEELEAAEAARRMSDKERRFVLGVEAAPDARTVDRVQTDLVSTARYAVRFQALYKLDRHCQRYEEMFAYGRARGWDLATPRGKNSRRIERPPNNRTSPFFVEVILQAEESGMFPDPETYLTFPMNDESGVSRTTPLFKNAGLFTIGFTQSSSFDGRGDEMFQSLLKCFPPDEQPAKLAELRRSVLDAGKGDLVIDESTYNVPLEDRFIALEAELAVRTGGMNETVRQQLDGLLDRHPVDDRANELYPHTWAKNTVDRIIRAGENQVRQAQLAERDQRLAAEAAEVQLREASRKERMRFGLSPEQFVDAWNALLDPSAEGVLDSGPQYCAWAIPDARKAVGYFSPPATPLSVSDLQTRGALEATQVARLVDFGCVAARPARVRTVDEVLTLLEDAVDEAASRPGDCHRGAMTLKQLVDLNRPLMPSLPTEDVRFSIAGGMLQTYYNVLYLPGCVAE